MITGCTGFIYWQLTGSGSRTRWFGAVLQHQSGDMSLWWNVMVTLKKKHADLLCHKSALVIVASRIKWHMIKKSVIGLFLFEFLSQDRIIRITEKDCDLRLNLSCYRKAFFDSSTSRTRWHHLGKWRDGLGASHEGRLLPRATTPQVAAAVKRSDALCWDDFTKWKRPVRTSARTHQPAFPAEAEEGKRGESRLSKASVWLLTAEWQRRRRELSRVRADELALTERPSGSLWLGGQDTTGGET